MQTWWLFWLLEMNLVFEEFFRGKPWEGLEADIIAAIASFFSCADPGCSCLIPIESPDEDILLKWGG